jgi:hypothetical protein
MARKKEDDHTRSFSDLFGSAAGVDTNIDTLVDIITFAESEWGFGMGTTPGVPALLPAQKFILKCYYGVPLEEKEKVIPIYDRFNENLLYSFTEKEFAQYLYDTGRLNTLDFGEHRTTLAMICGRRGTKTTVTALIAGYELYRMLSRYHPQAYFGIMPDDLISMTCLSTSKENALVLYKRTTANITRSPFFREYLLKNPNQTNVEFQSTRDIEKYGKKSKQVSIEFVADACSSNAGRGPSNIFVALDEVAHFFQDDKDKSSGNSDQAVYDAVTPSLAMFKNPNGLPAGKIILISSPAQRSGLLYDEYERSFDKEKGSDVLMIQLPSWEMNPMISAAYLRSKYHKSPKVYDCEFGAEFSDRLSGWIEDEAIVRNCVKPGLRTIERSSLRIPYFMGVDVGLKNDGTAVAIVHVEDEVINGIPTKVIVLDNLEIIYASDVKKDSESEKYFTPAEITEFIISFTQKFHVVKGLLDQYYGMAFMPLITAKNVNMIEARTFTDVLNNTVYQTLMAKFMTGAIRLPESTELDNLGRPKDTSIVTELLTLQAIHKSKHMLKVKAPEGKHDDQSDALARAVMLAVEYIDKGGSSGKVAAVSSSSGIGARSRLRKDMARMDVKRPTPGMIYKSGLGGRYGGMGGLGPTFMDPGGMGPRRR